MKKIVTIVFAVFVSQLFMVNIQAQDVPKEASVNGKYSNLIQQLNCDRDKGAYGSFYEWGWWGGGSWCGQSGKAGYWVYVYPTWYIWSKVNDKPNPEPDNDDKDKSKPKPGPNPQPDNDDKDKSKPKPNPNPVNPDKDKSKPKPNPTPQKDNSKSKTK